MSARNRQKGFLVIDDETGERSFIFVNIASSETRKGIKELFVLRNSVYFVIETENGTAEIHRIDEPGGGTTRISTIRGEPVGSAITNLLSNRDTLDILTYSGLFTLSQGEVRSIPLRPPTEYPTQLVGSYKGSEVLDQYPYVYISTTRTWIPTIRGDYRNVVEYSAPVIIGQYLYREYFAVRDNGRQILELTRLDLENGETESLRTKDYDYQERGKFGVGRVGNILCYTWPNDEGRLELFAAIDRGETPLEQAVTQGLTLLSPPTPGRDNTFFTATKAGGAPAVYKVDQNGEVPISVLSLQVGEVFIDLADRLGTEVIITNRRAVATNGEQVVYEVSDTSYQLRKLTAVADGWLITAQRDNFLSYRSIHGDGTLGPWVDSQLAAYARNLTRKSYAVIDNQVFTGGVLADRSTEYFLYDFAVDRLVRVAFYPDENSFDYKGPVLAAHQGQFYFSGISDLLGAELHYFDPGTNAELTGVVFHDLNEDGVRQPQERGVANQRILATGQGYSRWTYSASNGVYTLPLNSKVAYQVSTVLSDCYSDLHDSNFILGADREGKITEYDFPVATNAQITTLTPRLESSAIRCGFTIPFWLTVTNDGCQVQDGSVTVELPDDATLISSDLNPATENDGILSWDYTDLAPGAHYRVKLQLEMPDETFAGEEIPFLTHTTTTDTNGALLRDTFLYNDILRCAIDPNDKRSWPHRPEESMSNYTQLDEAITYTIRFQNTGNDTAFTVRLEDKLSNDLDWETFKPLTASHDYRVTLREGGNLEVLFPNILLVDSIRNEPASHGFFTFEIMAREGLADFTAIENTAGIYFDFNQPVITNTVKNTIVEVLDADGDGYNFYADCDDTNAAINPGAIDTPGNGVDENCDGVDGTTSVQAFAGTLVQLAPNPTRDAVQLTLAEDAVYRYSLYNLQGRRVGEADFRKTTTISLTRLPAGVYLLHLRDERGGALTRRVVRQ